MDLDDGIAILDFGGQYTHLIAKRLKELKIRCFEVPYSISKEELKNVKGIILSGSPSSVHGKDILNTSFSVDELDVPVLGICYGHQLMAYQLGGEVKSSRSKEYGKASIYIVKKDILFDSVPSKFTAWLSHSDTVSSLPKSASILAKSEFNDIAAVCYKKGKLYSVQFHPEVSHTKYGKRILENFAKKICGCRDNFTDSDFIEQTIRSIREKVASSYVLCAVSGGLDSTTAAVLARNAIGNRLKCVFINHGFFRDGEPEEIISLLRDKLALNLDYIDASELFMKELRGIKDPEEKRLIVGRIFARIFEEYVSKSDKKYEWLLQGTLYPDVIESSMPIPGSPRIKAHHNVAGLPEKMSLKLLEPLRSLYKDEVRRIARMLGIPEEIVSRHPFPGPGLSVRIIGEVTKEKLQICREASRIFEEELKRSKLYSKLWQAFAIVGDDKAVAVKGDNRNYGYIVTLKAVSSEDGMTASFYRLPWSILDRVSRKITNQIPSVAMVTYAISNKPPSTIEPQ